VKPRAEERTKAKGGRGARLAFLFLLGVLLFNYPLLALFNVQGSVFGVPLLYAYIFAAWALMIALVATVMERAS
jgi:hypothetical protein